MYLIHYKNLCKCHNVPPTQHNNNRKKNKVIPLGGYRLNRKRKRILPSSLLSLPSSLPPFLPSLFPSLFPSFFGSTGVRIEGFLLVRLVLYPSIHTPSSPFCSGYFGDRVPFFAQASLDCNPPIYVSHCCGMTGVNHYAQPFLFRLGLTNFFFARLTWNCDPPSPSLLHSWMTGTACIIMPSYCLRWESHELFDRAGLELTSS
jgi:hypothetical protein